MSGYGQPYWWDGQTPMMATSPSAWPSSCDVLIVGAGYTGLSAAITAAQAGADVCVFDARQIGFGASSRNGGMVGAHPRQSLAALSKQLGPKIARQIFNEANSAFAYFKSLIQDFKIECDYQTTGRIQLAWTQADFLAQQSTAAAMNKETNVNVIAVPRAELHHHIKTKHYFGGLYYPEHGALQPYKFVQALLATAMKLGAKVISDCPIERIERTRNGFIAHSAKGAISAHKVILASNGYTQGKTALGWLARRVFPLPSYLIATEVLPETVIKELAPAGRMMVETRAKHSYWRISPDGKRIIWGGRAAIRPIDLHLAIRRLRKTMIQIWPALRDVKITHAWLGNTGYSFEALPKIGMIDGIHYAAGYCGGGVVLAPYLGMKIARQALNAPHGQTAYSMTTLSTRPYYHGGNPWFLRPMDHWYNWVIDPLETLRAKRDQRNAKALSNNQKPGGA